MKGEKITMECLVGRTIINVNQVAHNDDVTEIEFTFSEGPKVTMLHNQDCCEYVRVKEIWGDLDDIVGEPLLSAVEASHGGYDNSEYGDTETWTFYRFQTIKGCVQIAWCGESNGYYSEEVELIEV